jgi:hypothetical protein
LCLVFGGSWLVWLLVGWLLSAPLFMIMLVVEHNTSFRILGNPRTRRPGQTAPDNRPVTNKSTVFKKI